MYVAPNFASKKALKVAVAARAQFEKDGTKVDGEEPAMVMVFSPGPFPAKRDGEESVEGPHYPKPHSWYARVKVVNGQVVKVLS